MCNVLKSFFDEELLRFINIALVKVRFFEKVTKIWSCIPLDLTLLSDIKNKWKIKLQIFVAFSENTNFKFHDATA